MGEVVHQYHNHSQHGSIYSAFIKSTLQGEFRELFVVVFDRGMVHVLQNSQYETLLTSSDE